MEHVAQHALCIHRTRLLRPRPYDNLHSFPTLSRGKGVRAAESSHENRLDEAKDNNGSGTGSQLPIFLSSHITPTLLPPPGIFQSLGSPIRSSNRLRWNNSRYAINAPT